MKTPDEFRIPVETGKIPLELTAQMKWNIAETISRIHEDGIELGAGDYVDVDDLKYICQAASYLMLYAQQLEAERDAAVEDVRLAFTSYVGACKTCKSCENQADCIEPISCARCENEKCVCQSCNNDYSNWEWRGVQKEE